MSDEIDWSDVPDQGMDPQAVTRNAIGRYCRLETWELKVLRRGLHEQMQKARADSGIDDPERVFPKMAPTFARWRMRRMAAVCEMILKWSDYSWSWEYILEDAEDSLRNHAERVSSALNAVPEDAACTAVFRRAMRYAMRSATFDPERYEKAWRDYKVTNMVPKQLAKLRTISEAWDDPETVEHRPARRAYERAGWSGAREGGREEMEALTQAILWTRPS